MLNKIKALIEAQEITKDYIIEAMVDGDQIIEQSDYNDNLFEYDGMEFLVVTEEEAIAEHNDYIENLWDDLGLECFSESTQEYIIENFTTDNGFFSECMNESNEFYIDEIRDEVASEDEDGNEITRLQEEMEENNCETEDDYLEHLNNQYIDGMTWYRENFGEESFLEIAKNNLNFDIEKIAEYCRECDGIAHNLAGYDGNEEEVKIEDEVFYIYRTN